MSIIFVSLFPHSWRAMCFLKTDRVILGYQLMSSKIDKSRVKTHKSIKAYLQKCQNVIGCNNHIL